MNEHHREIQEIEREFSQLQHEARSGVNSAESHLRQGLQELERKLK